MDQLVSFDSDGLALSGVLTIPDFLGQVENVPAFIVLHGFGSNKNAGNVLAPCKMLNDWGYATLRFDMRGCGDSGGPFGHILCHDQVSDTRNAIGFLQRQAGIDAEKIGLLGSSFGAAVALYTGSIDKRAKCVVSSGGWGNGERKFRGQHPTQESWARFTKLLEDGQAYRKAYGEPLMVSRYDIVPIPEHMRHHVLERSVQMFPTETAQSMFDFRAEELIHQLAPRPLLLLHSSVDSVTPTEQSIALFEKAQRPKELHLFDDTDHFMFADSAPRVRSVVKDWLARYFASPLLGKSGRSSITVGEDNG